MTIIQLALQWWESLEDYNILTRTSKSTLTEYYYTNRRFNSLKDYEIGEIFQKEFTLKGIVDLLLIKRKEIEKLIFSLDEKALINYELEQLNK